MSYGESRLCVMALIVLPLSGTTLTGLPWAGLFSQRNDKRLDDGRNSGRGCVLIFLLGVDI
jgi:hypothetical protein